MRLFSIAGSVAGAVIVTLLRGAASDGAQRAGTICSNPDHPCRGFRAQDLSFVLPRGEVARDEARSDAFYAVILRSGPRCSIPEAARVAAQARFPGRKVFSQRFECDDDVENNITYAGVAADRAFLAVYAGPSRQQAIALATRAAQTFPGANARQMRVVFVYP